MVTVCPDHGADGAPIFRVKGCTVSAEGEIREFNHVAASPMRAWSLAILEIEIAFGRSDPEVIAAEPGELETAHD